MIPIESIPPNFPELFRKECIEGSAIAPELYAAVIEFVEDSGKWETYQALGLQVRTQWQIYRPHDFGILAGFKQETGGDCWQYKPEFPRSDRDGKAIKYQCRQGAGSPAFLPPIPVEIRAKISQNYGVEVPTEGSFWDWLELHPEIPIVVTEGGKKGLAALTQGYATIALTGVNGGYRRVGESRQLIPDVARFCQPGRRVVLAFDQDAATKTRQRVERALFAFGKLLQDAGCEVSVATWHQTQGKGLDDLIVQSGAAALDVAIADALPLNQWQTWNRLERRLTLNPDQKVNTRDMDKVVQVEALPDEGIIAIAAPKGTGKTKLSGAMIGDAHVLSLGHRIALMRSLCQRLGLDYRGDINGAKRAGMVAGGTYRIGVGSCVESLLAINPKDFERCDLILDECVQVIRSLLTSSTCNHGGKRPALLRRLHDLVQVARRVILLDADLDNHTLHYFQELRGDQSPVYLIRNDYKSTGYPCTVYQSRGFDPVIDELLTRLEQQQPGTAILLTTDERALTQNTARLVGSRFPEKRVLVINSETSGGEDEREFIEHPDRVLERGDYDVIIASPSLATGISIESQGTISAVLGIFKGVSIVDSDILQALARVREPVQRLVWVAHRGSSWSKVSRSTNAIGIKAAMMEQTAATVSLVRSSLREDAIAGVQSVDWQSDPHLNLYCHFAAEQNRSMYALRDAVLTRLRHEGHQVTLQAVEDNPAIRLLYQESADEERHQGAVDLVKSQILNAAEAKVLEAKKPLEPAEQLALNRYYLCEFYGINPDDLTVELVLWDANGRRRAEIRSLEGVIDPETARDTSSRGIDQQAFWGKGNCPWDISHAATRAELRRKLGLMAFLDPEREWMGDDCAEIAEIARQYTSQIQDILKFTITDRVTDTQIVHQILSQLGIKIRYRWQGSGKEKRRVYRLDMEVWQQLTDIMQRRQERRERLDSALRDEGSPPLLINQNQGGDPNPEPPETTAPWLSPEAIAGLRQSIALATDPETLEALRPLYPDYVWRVALPS